MKEYINSYNRLNINKWNELLEVYESDAEAYDKNLAIVSILTDIDTDELMNMKLTKFNELLQNAAFLGETPKPGIVANKYIVGDFILVPMLKVNDMSTVQFVDYQTFCKDINKNLVNILSIFLVPKNHQYKDGEYDLDKVREVIGEKLFVSDAISLSAFFLILFKSWLKATRISLEKKMKKMMKKKIVDQEMMEKMEKSLKDLEAVGDGYLWWTE